MKRSKVKQMAVIIYGRWILIVILVLVCLRGSAAVLAVTPPDAGAVLQGVPQPETQPPGESSSGEIKIPAPETASPSGNPQKIRVNGFRISGETIRPAKELLALIDDRAGQELTLDELNGLATRITKYLRQNGYPVAFAYLPAQQVKDGIVEIAVIPGKYGEMKIHNASRVDTRRLQKMLDALRPGALITQQSLERSLLLINDLSGVSVRATLQAGEAPGTADLVLDVGDTAIANGNVNADNRGSRYTGQYRGGVQLTVNNPDHIGDELSLGGLSSARGLDNGNLAYNAPLGSSGLRLNLSYNTVSYSLGEDFAALDATGQAQVYGLELNYPLIRSRQLNLYASAGFDNKDLRDVIGSTATTTPRTSNLWHLGLAGNASDAWRGGGVNNFSLTLSSGYLKITDAAAYNTDANSAHSAGGFGKALLSYNRSQYLATGLDLALRFNSQLATGNLDSSEKFYLGGADGVRAYPQGEGAGDEGLRLTAEVKWRIPEKGDAKEQLFLAGFCDYGYITVNKNPWDATAGNSRGLSAIGLGLIYAWNSGFYLRCDYAWKIGSGTVTSDTDQPGRFWIRAEKRF